MLGISPSITPLSLMDKTPFGSNKAFRRSNTEALNHKNLKRPNEHVNVCIQLIITDLKFDPVRIDTLFDVILIKEIND